jgi:anti-sigma factor RsiW
MACDQWGGKLDLYLDDELPESQTSALDVHLRGCTSCAADALQRVQLKRAVRSAGKQFSPTPEFRRKIQQQISDAAHPARRWFWLPQLGLAAAFAAVLFIAGFGLMHRLWRNQAFSEVADLHVATLASQNPFDVSGPDRHTVKPWFAGKLPFTFNLPQLQNSNFQLLGARLAYLDQEPGAELVYQTGKHRISVFIFQDRGRLTRVGSLGQPERRVSFTVETWSDAGLRYVVIGDAGAADIHTLSDMMKTAAGL